MLVVELSQVGELDEQARVHDGGVVGAVAPVHVFPAVGRGVLELWKIFSNGSFGFIYFVIYVMYLTVYQNDGSYMILTD